LLQFFNGEEGAMGKGCKSAIVASGLAGLALGIIGVRLGGHTHLFVFLPLVGAVAGVMVGNSSAGRRYSGLALGAAFGILAWDVAIAHYMRFDFPLTELAWLMGAIISAAVGVLVALVSGSRGDALTIGTVASLSIGGHLVARIWLEDYPTRTGLAALVVGGVIGLYLARARWFRRPRGIILGVAAAGACAQFIAFPILASTGLLWRSSLLSPQVVMGSLALMGMMGGWLALGANGTSRTKRFS
jgi:hypothetical protein